MRVVEIDEFKIGQTTRRWIGDRNGLQSGDQPLPANLATSLIAPPSLAKRFEPLPYCTSSSASVLVADGGVNRAVHLTSNIRWQPTESIGKLVRSRRHGPCSETR